MVEGILKVNRYFAATVGVIVLLSLVWFAT